MLAAQKAVAFATYHSGNMAAKQQSERIRSMKSGSTKDKQVQALQMQRQKEGLHHSAAAGCSADKRNSINVVRRNILMLFALAVAFLTVSLSAKVQAEGLPDFEKLISEQGQAVVQISVTGRQEVSSRNVPELQQLPEPLRRYFESLPQQPMPELMPSTGFGSGFIISQDGLIVTNAHVVDGATEITVSLPDRREYSASIVGSDERSDIAVLKVDATDLPTLALGDSSDVNVGQWVLAIGSPFGFEYTATQGIISAVSRTLPNENYVPFIQTDAAVNPGNSGGPLFDTDGQVIGVNAQIFSRSGGFMGLSFAIPINVVKSVVDQLTTTGYVSRGWLGCLLYTSPSPRDATLSRMPSSA